MRRSIWKEKKTFITIGASDWETTVWIDGNLLGKHQGGYVPFSFDLTPYLKYGKNFKPKPNCQTAKLLNSTLNSMDF